MFNLLSLSDNEVDKSVVNLSIDILDDNRIVGFINKNIRDTGAYMIIVNSDRIDGANGIYCISRSDKSKYGMIKNMCESTGIYNERIDIKWDPYEYPKLVLRETRLNTNKNVKLSYKVKIVF